MLMENYGHTNGMMWLDGAVRLGNYAGVQQGATDGGDEADAGDEAGVEGVSMMIRVAMRHAYRRQHN